MKSAKSYRAHFQPHIGTAKKALQSVRQAPMDTRLKFLVGALDKGIVAPDQVRSAIENEAPKNMKEGAQRIAKEGKPITVDTLLEDYRQQTDFQRLAARVGLDESWFVALAEKVAGEWKE